MKRSLQYTGRYTFFFLCFSFDAVGSVLFLHFHGAFLVAFLVNMCGYKINTQQFGCNLEYVISDFLFYYSIFSNILILMASYCSMMQDLFGLLVLSLEYA